MRLQPLKSSCACTCPYAYAYVSPTRTMLAVTKPSIRLFRMDPACVPRGISVQVSVRLRIIRIRCLLCLGDVFISFSMDVDVDVWLLVHARICISTCVYSYGISASIS